MTAAEEGMLLLCSRLGDPESKPMTMPQFRELGLRIRASGMPEDRFRELQLRDLTVLGYEEENAARILGLLNRQSLLHRYLAAGQQQGIHPITRISPQYPRRFRDCLRDAAPAVLFYHGDLALLERPAMAVVGSRKLRPENEAFARAAGRLAAETGLVLVSGGAAGADLAAQEACLEAGGSCVIFPADALERHASHPHILYLCADGYDIPFSTPRALMRNRLIHSLGKQVFAAQCTHGSGGTWQGCLENLKHSWSDLYVFDDGSPAMTALMEQGAIPLNADFTPSDWIKPQLSLFDP